MAPKAKKQSPPLKSADELHHWPLDKLIGYARNPRKNDHAVDKIVEAIHEFGFRVPILAKSDGSVIDGHLRLKAAKRLGMATVPVLLADDMTDAQIKAFRISVNRMAELADWDYELLQVEMEELGELGFDLGLTGFDMSEITAMLADERDEGEQGEEDEGETGDNLLALIDVTIAEPTTEVDPGDVWRLGDKHVLVCACVLTDHAQWAEYLQAESIFCPYPSPFVALSAKADVLPLVLVQPDTYIAGHIVDRYAEAYGADAVEKLSD